ncbi:glutamate decarboxylase [Maridesulfovibrio sp.]|uniref:glutamate decarboxylase n=1 Tax=Maridesulfovibrio sp. TaxID=2795000 RepID=UPI002AA863CC|nr:glutamate decarboxylase [Maridesulfovibrio sp.]
MLHHVKKDKRNSEDRKNYIMPIYGSRDLEDPIPKYALPEGSIDPRHAYSLVRDELMLDGNSRLNLATFVTTWMEDEARQLMTETFDKNMIDKDEYPQTAELEDRCVHILSDLYNSPDEEHACGCSTTGSSEAAMLCGMALKWKWRDRMKAKGKPTDKPNMIISASVQVCWEKFCRYWEVEPRLIPVSDGHYSMKTEDILAACDENTIGVVAILGTTHTGDFEPVKEYNEALEKYNAETGYEIPLHVDAASGGFIAPFLQPEMEWDFRLKWVKSINVSGHKFGLVYPGVGWAIWRTPEELPEDLIFRVNYLGGEMPTFALNFSRPGNQVVAQYYNFIRLGREGYTRIMQACMDTANFIKAELEETGVFQSLLPKLHMPLITFRIRRDVDVEFDVYKVSEMLRHRGWLVPAYSMCENCEDDNVLRIVVKEGMSMDMAHLLMDDIRRIIKSFENEAEEKKTTKATFKHC